jgi:hypothetical protein
MQSKFVHLGLMLVVFAGMGLAQDLPPYSLDVAKLTRIVPDTVVYNTGTPNLDNWEPYTSVLGNSVFLIESNTFAEGSTTDQRYVLTFQPVPGVRGMLFRGRRHSVSGQDQQLPPKRQPRPGGG